MVDAACVMATQIPVTSQILMTRTNCYAVVNTIRVVATVTLAVLATSRRHGGSQKVTSLLYANVSTFRSLFHMLFRFGLSPKQVLKMYSCPACAVKFYRGRVEV